MEAQIIGTWVGIVASIVGTIIGLIKYFGTQLSKTRDESEARVSRVYERFDDYKKNIEEKFVYKDMCHNVHQNGSENFRRLEERVEKGFSELTANLNNLRDTIMNKQ